MGTHLSDEDLGLDADQRLGMDRERTLADAGLDSSMPLPDPAANYGPLSGIWLSEYEYPSSSRETCTSTTGSGR
jgi:hypothetical protein